MDWKERFRRIADLDDQKRAEEFKRTLQKKEQSEKIREERIGVIKALIPQIERVCKAYSRGVKGKMHYERNSYGRENVTCNLEAKFGSIAIFVAPTWNEKVSNTHGNIRGIELRTGSLCMRQHVSVSSIPELRSSVDISGISSVQVDKEDYFSLPRQSGFYHELQYRGIDSSPDQYLLRYFITLDEFTEKVFAKALENLSYIRVKLGDHFDQF